jgi:hypothetical protein
MRHLAEISKYEYLELLSFTEWKSDRQIKEEMFAIKGGWITVLHVNHAMMLLLDEDLVEISGTDDPTGINKTLIIYRRKSHGGGIRDPEEDDETEMDFIFKPA